MFITKCEIHHVVSGSELKLTLGENGWFSARSAPWTIYHIFLQMLVSAQEKSVQDWEQGMLVKALQACFLSLVAQG